MPANNKVEYVIVSPLGNILRSYDEISKAQAFMDTWTVEGLKICKKTTTFEEVEVANEQA